MQLSPEQADHVGDTPEEAFLSWARSQDLVEAPRTTDHVTPDYVLIRVSTSSTRTRVQVERHEDVWWVSETFEEPGLGSESSTG